jgi:Uma2 family endonuclease
MDTSGGEPVHLLMPAPTKPFTVADLDALPDDGHRYEIVDGSLVVSAAPTNRHQIAMTRMVRLLDRAAPDHLLVLASGCGLALRDDRHLLPDGVVVGVAADPEANMLVPADVVLVLEVVSPSNAGNDLVLKREYYREHGIPHYWMVDVRAEPVLIALRLVDGKYVETLVGPDETVTLEHPFPVTVRPSDLTRWPR